MKDTALIERITRSLAFMLRHQPDRFDLELDELGYADLDDTVRALNEKLGEPIEAEDVIEAVHSGDRQRYEIEGDRIRALYGHSIPVEPGPATKPPETLFVPIPADAVRRAQRFGLRGGRRSFLHLALSCEDACETGRRIGREYTVLRIRALDAWEEGVNFYDRRALWLAEEVPTHLLEVEGSFEDGEDPPLRSTGRSSGPRGRGRDQDRGRGRDQDRGRGRGRDQDRDHERREPQANSEREEGWRDSREEERERVPASSSSDREETERPAGRDERDTRRDDGSNERGERGRSRGRSSRGGRGTRGGRDAREDRGDDRGRDRGDDRGRSSERPVRPERTERPERSDRPDRSERPNREDRRDRDELSRGRRPAADSPKRPEPRRAPQAAPSSGGSFGDGVFAGAKAKESAPAQPATRPALREPKREEAPRQPEEVQETAKPTPSGPGFGAGLEG